MALSVGALVSAGPAAAQTPGPRIFVGAVGGSAHELSAKLGARVASHGYGQLMDGVATGRMVTMRDNNASWADVANAQPGSAIYANIVRWAKTLRARHSVIYFAYHHEPEASGSVNFGTPAQYIAAYRHVVSIFRAYNVRNVRFTWQMTSWSFMVPLSDRRAAAHWYPGNRYVDVVASDAYNMYNQPPGKGVWRSLRYLASPTLRFARAHGKRMALAEFACVANPRRPAWLNGAHQWLTAHRSQIAAAFYFNLPGHGHSYPLVTDVSKRAFDRIARDTANFRR